MQQRKRVLNAKINGWIAREASKFQRKTKNKQKEVSKVIFTEILTVILVMLKATNTISLPWLMVFVPEIIAVMFYCMVILGVVIRTANDEDEKRRRQNKSNG